MTSEIDFMFNYHLDILNSWFKPILSMREISLIFDWQITNAVKNIENDVENRIETVKGWK